MNTTLMQPPAADRGTLEAPRCLRLRPLRAETGLPPALIGVGEIVLGSAVGAGVRLPIDGVGERHCVIAFDGRSASVQAISPFTWVNDGPVRETPLRSGDVLAVGPVELRVDFVEVAAPPPPPPPAPLVVESSPRRVPEARQLSPPVDPPVARPPHAIASDDIQPLLDEAYARRDLTRSLRRVEEELDWRSRTSTAATPEPSATATRTAPPPASSVAPRRVSARPIGDATTDQGETERRRREFEQRDAALHARERELDSRELQLQDRARVLEAQSETLANAHQEFEAAVEALDADRKELQQSRAAWRQQAAAERERLDSQRREVLAARQAVQQARDQAASLLTELTARDAELTRREVPLSAREQALTERTEQINHQQHTLAADAERLRVEEQSLERLKSLLERRQQSLTEREQAAGELESRLAAERDELDCRRSELDTEAASLSKESQELARGVDELARQRAAHGRECADLEARREVMNEQEQRLRQDEEALRQRCLQADAEREQLTLAEEALARGQSELETAFAEQRRTLDSERSTLEAAQKALNADRIALSAERQRVEELTTKTTRLRTQTEEQVAALADVQDREAALTAARQELETRQAQLEVCRAELSAEQRQVEEHGDALAREREALDARACELDTREAQLHAAQLELAAERQNVVVDARDVPGVERGSQLDEAEAARLAAREVDLTQLAEELAAAQSEIAREAALLEEQRRELQAESNERGSQQSALDERARALDQRERVLDASERELARRRHDAFSAEEEATVALRDQVLDLQGRIEHLEGERRRLELLLSGAAPGRSHAAPLAETEAATESEAVWEPVDDEHQQAPLNPSEEHSAALEDMQPTTPAAVSAPADAEDASPAAHTESLLTDNDPQSLRSQLASLFGIAPERLSEREHTHHPPQEEPSTRSAGSEDAPTSSAGPAAPLQDLLRDRLALAVNSSTETEVPAAVDASAAAAADEHHEDSIEAYMQRLLSRNQSGATPAAQEPADTKGSLEMLRERLTASMQESASEAPVATPAPAPRTPRRLDQQEIASLRANIDSMRQIANQSARAAVAQHYSQKLSLSLQVKIWMTVICAFVTVALFSAEFWGPNSYRLQGIGALQITLIAGLELARTLIRLRRVSRIAAGSDTTAAEEAPTNEGDPETTADS